jgi:Lrp/AsnC family transcriptional regulator for asnA, asnC and gidA
MNNNNIEMKLDAVDMAIIRHLWDGRTPYSEIAKKLNLSTNTVRTRVNKLIKNNVFQIIGLVTPEVVPNHRSAIVAFKVEPNSMKQAMKQISILKNIVAVVCVSGHYDIMALAMFNDKCSHKNFVFKELPHIEGLLEVETFFVIDSINWQLRYVI